MKLLGESFFYYRGEIQNKYLQSNKNAINYTNKECTMKLITVKGLALGPYRNLHGGICCYSLDTDKVLDNFLHDATIMKILIVECHIFAY